MGKRCSESALYFTAEYKQCRSTPCTSVCCRRTWAHVRARCVVIVCVPSLCRFFFNREHQLCSGDGSNLKQDPLVEFAMPNKCCVPHCRGNYDSTCKVRVFRFPQDEEQRRKWVRAIPRENFSPTQYSRVSYPSEFSSCLRLQLKVRTFHLQIARGIKSVQRVLEKGLKLKVKRRLFFSIGLRAALLTRRRNERDVVRRRKDRAHGNRTIAQSPHSSWCSAFKIPGLPFIFIKREPNKGKPGLQEKAA